MAKYRDWQECVCGDTIASARCNEGWCYDCAKVRVNRTVDGTSLFCVCHSTEVDAKEHCKRWENAS